MEDNICNYLYLGDWILGSGNWTSCRAILVWRDICDFKSITLRARSILKLRVWFQTKLLSTQFNYHYALARMSLVLGNVTKKQNKPDSAVFFAPK